jgi:hypothetical protein
LKILTFERFIFQALLRSGFAVTIISDNRYLKLVLLLALLLRASLLKALLFEAFSFSSFVDESLAVVTFSVASFIRCCQLSELSALLLQKKSVHVHIPDCFAWAASGWITIKHIVCH